jgi:hypothetical protein
MLLTTQVGVEHSHSRVFVAFSQHYALQQQFLNGFGLSHSEIAEGFQPWFDFSTLIARDFPGADSFSSALQTSPTYAVGYLFLNGLKALFMAWIGLGFGALKTIPIPILITFSALFFSSGRFRNPARTDAGTQEGVVDPKALYLTCLGFCALSSSAVLIWSIPRHVIGLTIALVLWLTWTFLNRANESVRTKAPIAIMIVSTMLAIPMAGYRVSQVGQRPNLEVVEKIDATVGDAPVSIAGSLSGSVCAYLETDACHPIHSLRDNPCEWFETGADYLVERLGVLDGTACEEQAKGYERLSWTERYDVRRKRSARHASISKEVPTPSPDGF